MSTDPLAEVDGSDGVTFWCRYCSEPQLTDDFVGDCQGCGRGLWQTLIEICRSEKDFDIFTSRKHHPHGATVEKVKARSEHCGLAIYLLQIFLARHTRKIVMHQQDPVHIKGDELVKLIYSSFYEMGLNAGFYWCEKLELDHPRRVCDLVYALVEEGLMHTQPSDQPKDFDCAPLGLYWFENRRRWQIVQRWRCWPLGGWWANRKIQRWREEDSQFGDDGARMIEADWQELVASESQRKTAPGHRPGG